MKYVRVGMFLHMFVVLFVATQLSVATDFQFMSALSSVYTAVHICTIGITQVNTRMEKQSDA